ncbi:MAG: glycosyltransferase [Cyanobacteria bacterium M_surface_10_m2_119]|nr:glycosyltransferase [Cyanobacteria bacterium M_surface_10_m2_119]
MAADGSANGNRRGKSALFLMACGAAGLAPHWLEPGWRLLPASALALLLGGYSFRTVLVPAFGRSSAPVLPDLAASSQVQAGGAPPAEGGEAGDQALPAVDVVVAARDEQAVIARLVEGIARLRYPPDALRLWVIDDASTDRTPQVLSELQQRHAFLQVLRREADAGGGKSGALNLALQHLQAPWMLVLDADADLQPDTLERLLPLAEQGGWGAVQLRKAVANPQANWLTRAQAMEMALDTVVQEGRLARGGVVELRGNGQLLRREALELAGGFNEETVTDDLDLSFRLLLHRQSVAILWDPPVREEAVLGVRALWRQRQRWAEGGLQRFFDYAPGLLSPALPAGARLDLLCFFLLQYVLPLVAVADLLGAVVTRSWPLIWPLSFVAFGLSGCSILLGCRRPGEGPDLPAMHPLNLLLGILYLGHWFLVIPYTTLRMALFPKRLVWAKTLHLGEDPAAA